MLLSFLILAERLLKMAFAASLRPAEIMQHRHQDVLERPATSYMQRHFVTLQENASVASAIEQMQ
ncbi:hypothetical protein Ngar_c33780 [Candidatus Nitrososphaera gargensis Ga9.2]|uniref:Uncharacterized protein n=1 Tax=Nitrososphaera gargensis (strain Ga9.2) TaxID=1237085 RepID=K0ILB2_NITGG|nr:hypothetical protein Ngar_c33780 [Candidatus Nitrososphaera gargensis Ga9.2]